MIIKGLSFGYGGSIIFDGLDIELPQPVCCIMGPSGRGKTTLLHIIAGLITGYTGSIEGIPKQPAVLFQEDRLLPWLNVKENVLLPLASDGLRLAAPKEAEERAGYLLKRLGIDPGLEVSELSGGMARRVSLARCLMLPSDMLLLDEPFRGLDADNARIAADLILEQKLPLIASTHSLDEAKLLGAEVAELPR